MFIFLMIMMGAFVGFFAGAMSDDCEYREDPTSMIGPLLLGGIIGLIIGVIFNGYM